MAGPESQDIAFGAPTPELIDEMLVWKACGKTKEVEDPAYQPEPTDVCAYWSSVPDHLVVPHYRSRVFTFFMTADKNETVARQEFIKSEFKDHIFFIIWRPLKHITWKITHYLSGYWHWKQCSGYFLLAPNSISISSRDNNYSNYSRLIYSTQVW